MKTRNKLLLLFAAGAIAIVLASPVPAQQAPPMTTVATLNDLLSRAPRAGEAIGVQTGYGGVEWGGLRTFVLQATNVTALPTNVAHVFAVTNVSGARGQWVSVDRENTVQDARWWRVNSGDTNINAAVQNIIDYGQTLGGVIVKFPEASYTLTAWPPIYVTNNTTLIGVPGQTIFNFSGATNQVQYGVAIHNATNAAVSGVSYWWPTNTLAVPNPETVIAVDIRNSRTVTVNEVNTTNLKGINVGGTQSSYDVQVSRLVATASPQVGGALTYASNVKFTDCVFQGSTGDYVTYNTVGFDVEPNTGQVANDIVFTRCGFLNNMEDGLSLVSSADRTMSNIRLVDCYSSSNGTSGLSIQAGEDIVVSGWQSTNDYSGFAFSGYGSIYVTLSKNVTILGSTIRGNANNGGIVVSGVNGLALTGNTIDGVTLDGIQVADATSREFTGVISLIGNRILRPARYGIYYSGVVGVQALGNTIIQAGQNGVHATFSINNIFANNLIAESGNSGNGYYGMRLAASSTNSVYGNTFLENLVSLNTTNQAGTVSTAQFGANAMAFDGYYNDCWLTITAGTGSGQVRQISGYAASTLIATVSTNWVTPPDGTSVLRVESGNTAYSQSGAIYLDDSRCVNNNVTDNNLGGLAVTDSGTSTKGVMTASTLAYAIDSQSFGSAAVVRESDAYTTEFRNVSTGVGQTRVYGYRTSSANYERLAQTVTAGVAGFVAMETAGTGADNLKLVLAGSGTESVYATYSGQSEVVSRWSGALASAPATPQIGDAFYNTTLSALGFWNGTSWVYPQNRTNHFGTQDITTVISATANNGDTLVWNGTQFVPQAPSVVVGSSPTFYLDHTASFADNYSLALSPSAAAESSNVVSVSSANSPAFLERWVSPALSRTNIAAGTWTFTTYVQTSADSGTNAVVFRVNRRVVQSGITGTFTGSGSTRTFTTSGGSPFTTNMATGSRMTAALIETTNQTAWISNYVSSSQVQVWLTDAGYVNETNVPLDAIYHYMFQSTTGDIPAGGTVQEVVSSTTQGSFTNLNLTDRLVVAYFGSTDSGVARNQFLYWQGNTRYSRFTAPIVTAHNDLAGLNVGDYQHLTAAELSDVQSLGTMAFIDDAPADNTVYGRSNNVWVATGTGSALTVGLYGGASWPNINEITFSDTTDLVWGLDELSPEVFPFAYTKNPVFFNNNGISSYAGGEKWNIQDSSKIAWTASARTNMSASIVANSLTTNDISSAFYSFITNQSTGGGGTTTYTTNHLTKALMQNAAALTVSSGTLTETNMITIQPSWGVTNFAAGYWTTNNALHVEASGTFTAAGDWSGNVFRVKLGAYILTYTFDEPDSTTPTDAAWRLVADIKVQTPGASATTMGVGSLTYYQGTPATMLQSGFIAAVPSGTLDTTVQNTLSVTYDNDATQPLTLKMASLFANEIGAEIVTASGGGSSGSGTLLLVNGATNTAWNLSSNTPAITEYGYGHAAPTATGTNVAFRIPQRVSLIVTNASSGTFTNPPWGRTIKGYLWGPGGGGGSGRRGLTNTVRGGGGGGGSGAYTEFIIPNLVGGETYNWTNFAGGVGAPSQTTASSNGNQGGFSTNTMFGPFIAGAGIPGSGGTAVGGTGGTFGFGSFNGASGGTASSSGASGSSGGSSSSSTSGAARIPGAGGSGGGLNVADATSSGGAGGTGDRSTAFTAGGASNVTLGAAGNPGGSSLSAGVITGGGGGGGVRPLAVSTAGTPGAAGNGGFPGGGGGGGAPGTDSVGVTGNNSGAGGDGAAGAIIIIVE